MAGRVQYGTYIQGSPFPSIRHFPQVAVIQLEGFECVGRLQCTRSGQNGAFTDEELEESMRYEASALKYLKKHHPTIPVPEVYLIELKKSNPVGAPFMLMEKVRMPCLSTSFMF